MPHNVVFLFATKIICSAFKVIYAGHKVFCDE